MNGRMSDFLGGSPLGVLVRLVVISLVVGFLMSWLGWSPREILFALEDFVRQVWRALFGSFDRVIDYFMLGAAIVFPLFIISRLLKLGRR